MISPALAAVAIDDRPASQRICMAVADLLDGNAEYLEVRALFERLRDEANAESGKSRALVREIMATFNAFDRDMEQATRACVSRLASNMDFRIYFKEADTPVTPDVNNDAEDDAA